MGQFLSEREEVESVGKGVSLDFNDIARAIEGEGTLDNQYDKNAEKRQEDSETNRCCFWIPTGTHLVFPVVCSRCPLRSSHTPRLSERYQG